MRGLAGLWAWLHADLNAIAALHDQLGEWQWLMIGDGQELIMSQQHGERALQLQHGKLLTCEDNERRI